ncbi:hypothetical protein PRZ48_009721 [Zasmidium cellare]|uniref:Uncharacterized protein n=1 Tax=Zasmidium cellare TaxID=395010 RepID=A0ABR0EDS1_ZASCE|nr:hypothetical protein PRZ48_009721 [Zasmidium cellare]
MEDSLAESLRTLAIDEGENASNTNRCLLLELLPAELRLEIYELALRMDPPVITIDLRYPTPPHRQTSPNLTCPDRPHDGDQHHPNPPIPTAFLLTCHQIHHEASPILYAINKIHIHAPIFTPKPRSHLDNSGIVLERLHRIAHLAHLLTNITLSLGRLHSLGSIRWMDFFTRWNAAVPAIKALREGVKGEVEVEFQTVLGKAGVVWLRFGVGSLEEVERGLAGGVRVRGGKVADMDEREGERLGALRRTVGRTLFEGDG